jgi:hypothetical protein
MGRLRDRDGERFPAFYTMAGPGSCGGPRVERKQIANIFVPAVAVAALIALAAVVIVSGGGSDSKRTGPDGKPIADLKPPAEQEIIPVATVASAAGMSERMPAVDGPEWKDIGDGLKIWDVTEGSGPEVAKGAQVTAHYSGWLLSGKVFDSSVKKRGSPIQFSLNRVVEGWKRGIPGMKPGGIRRLYIPSTLGYGAQGFPPDIPGNADLVFEVKLMSSP